MVETSLQQRPLLLLTGAQGKVGAAALPRLVEAGYRVRAITSRPVPRCEDPSVEWLRRDLRQVRPELMNDLDGCDAVLHLAAEQHDEEAMEQVNAEATRSLAMAAEASGVRTFCFTSSVSVYGSPRGPAADESAPVLDADVDRPEDYWVRSELRAYGRSKVQAENALRAVAQQVRYVILRPSAVVDAVDLREPLTMPPLQRAIAWRQRTQAVALGDMVEALLWALRRGASDVSSPGSVEVFNVSDERPPLTYGDLFTAAGDARVRFRGLPVPPMPRRLWHAVTWLRSPGRALRYPLGYASYPAVRLAAAGWTPPQGIRAAVADAFEPSDDRRA